MGICLKSILHCDAAAAAAEGVNYYIILYLLCLRVEF
jgi:hypothetical protein